MKIRIQYISVALLLLMLCQSGFAQKSKTRKSRRDTSAVAASLDTAKLKSSAKDSLEAPLYDNTYLDTVKLNTVFVLNDYSMVGVEYGAQVSRTMFNPTKDQTMLFSPTTFGVYYTRYGKLFNYLPYFGLKIGLQYGHEGYKFKENKETKITPNVEGATQALIDFVDIPMMAMFHKDFPHFTILADAGIYGGYRLNITRTGDNVDPSILNDFLSYDNRWDYGLTGGAGFGFVFDPFEFQINANVRYAWGSLYEPDYYSKDYYRFAYPLDISVKAGLYFHLTRRTGKTRPQLKKEAYDMVYHPKTNEDTNSQSR